MLRWISVVAAIGIGAGTIGSQAFAATNFNTQYVCHSVLDGNVNGSAKFTIAAGQVTIQRRLTAGIFYTDVVPHLESAATPSAPSSPNSVFLSPAPFWFSGMNPYNGARLLTAGPIKEDASSLEIRVDGTGTTNEGRKSFGIRHALRLNKKTGELDYIAQVAATGPFPFPFETRIAVKMSCQEVP